MYYNTTDLKHQELQTATGQAKHQDERILNYFKDHPSSLFSPEEVHAAIFTSQTPITSIRRSMNTLTESLFLEKTNTYKQGMYGKRVHTWRLRVINNELTLF